LIIAGAIIEGELLCRNLALEKKTPSQPNVCLATGSANEPQE